MVLGHRDADGDRAQVGSAGKVERVEPDQPAGQRPTALGGQGQCRQRQSPDIYVKPVSGDMTLHPTVSQPRLMGHAHVIGQELAGIEQPVQRGQRSPFAVDLFLEPVPLPVQLSAEIRPVDGEQVPDGAQRYVEGTQDGDGRGRPNLGARVVPVTVAGVDPGGGQQPFGVVEP